MSVVIADSRVFRGGGRLVLAALVVAAIGLVGFIVGLAIDSRTALASYLIAWFFVVTVAIGLLAFTMGAYAMNAGWPTALRRVVEMGFGALPLLVVLYFPLFWSVERLYPWAHPELVADHHAREIVIHKLPVMNPPFFFVRAIAFLLLWTIVGEILRAASLRMDRPDPPQLKDYLRGFSSVALPIVGLTGTFASFDWVMSLSPDFYSTMYGLYVLSGGFVAAIGLTAIMMSASQSAGFLVGIHRSHWYAIGRLLFAFLVFWAYTGFFQYLLVWIANKPVEADFYAVRLGGWNRWAAWFLALGHFFVPWLILLSYSVKRRRWTVTFIGAWILFCHYIDIHWLVGARRGGPPWSWQDVPAVLFVGGLVVAFAVWRQRGHMLSAYYDPDYPRGVSYESR